MKSAPNGIRNHHMHLHLIMKERSKAKLSSEKQSSSSMRTHQRNQVHHQTLFPQGIPVQMSVPLQEQQLALMSVKRKKEFRKMRRNNQYDCKRGNKCGSRHSRCCKQNFIPHHGSKRKSESESTETHRCTSWR
jgi:hypothetical protein